MREKNRDFEISEAEIMAKRTPAGGWTRTQLAQWGVPWPPPKGWKKALVNGGVSRRTAANNAIAALEAPTDPDLACSKSAPSSPNFTNHGKAEAPETPVKQGQKRLTRVPFKVSRLMEFCTRRELVNQTGHDINQWLLVILKELVDNGIDACEEAEIAPTISVTVTKGGSIIVEDNGPGIPAKTIESVLDYAIRVRSNEA